MGAVLQHLNRAGRAGLWWQCLLTAPGWARRQTKSGESCQEQKERGTEAGLVTRLLCGLKPLQEIGAKTGLDTTCNIHHLESAQETSYLQHHSEIYPGESHSCSTMWTGPELKWGSQPCGQRGGWRPQVRLVGAIRVYWCSQGPGIALPPALGVTLLSLAFPPDCCMQPSTWPKATSAQARGDPEQPRRVLGGAASASSTATPAC